MARGSLVFGAATTDRVDVGNAALLDLDPFTWLFWCYPTSLTAGMRLASTNVSSGSDNKFLNAPGTSTDNLRLAVTRATANTNYITNTTPIATKNKWFCVAVTWSSAATPAVTLYVGDLATALTAQTFGTATNGSGALVSETGGTACIGNRTASPVVPWIGRISHHAIFNAVLSLADCLSWQKLPRKTVGANVAKGFWRLGKDGADAIEYTGLGNGTVTGATQGDGPPVGGHWTRGTSGLYQRAA